MSKLQIDRPKAYSYVRFSTPEQAKGDSLIRQTEAARQYAARNGLELDGSLTFRDLGVSAHHGKNAAAGALGAFLEAVKVGEVAAGSFLLVESLDRISRQTVRKAVRTLESIVESGITVVDLSDGGKAYNEEGLDRDQFGFIMMALRFIRAHEESATKGMRVTAAYDRKRAAAAANVAQVKPFTRQLPAWLGWDEKHSKYFAIPDRAKVIQEIFSKFASGSGQHRIAHWLNSSGTKPWGDAVHWHRSYVRKILGNRAAIGTFTPHKALRGEGGVRVRKPLEPIPNYWPAVIEADLFERAAALLNASSARGRHADNAPKSIFAGVMHCAHCGRSVIRSSKGEHVYLVCSQAHARAGCKYQAVRYADVEAAFVTNARAIVGDAPRGKSTREIDEEISQLDHALHEMSMTAGDLVEELAATRSEAVRKALRELEERTEQGRARLNDLVTRRDRAAGPHVAKRLEKLRTNLIAKSRDIAEINKSLKETLEKIVIDPEAGELVIHWRHASKTRSVQFRSKHSLEFTHAILQ